MHINERRKGVRKNDGIKPGQQVASNRALHNDMRLVEGVDGYDAVVERGDRHTLIRGHYYPIGNNFHYPKVWGRKYAATKLCETIMEDKRKIIQEAEGELIKLQKCLDKVNLWSDTDL